MPSTWPALTRRCRRLYTFVALLLVCIQLQASVLMPLVASHHKGKGVTMAYCSAMGVMMVEVDLSSDPPQDAGQQTPMKCPLCSRGPAFILQQPAPPVVLPTVTRHPVLAFHIRQPVHDLTPRRLHAPPHAPPSSSLS